MKTGYQGSTRKLSYLRTWSGEDSAMDTLRSEQNHAMKEQTSMDPNTVPIDSMPIYNPVMHRQESEHTIPTFCHDIVGPQTEDTTEQFRCARGHGGMIPVRAWKRWRWSPWKHGHHHARSGGSGRRWRLKESSEVPPSRRDWFWRALDQRGEILPLCGRRRQGRVAAASLRQSVLTKECRKLRIH
jgi:hypothetical protein